MPIILLCMQYMRDSVEECKDMFDCRAHMLFWYVQVWIRWAQFIILLLEDTGYICKG